MDIRHQNVNLHPGSKLYRLMLVLSPHQQAQCVLKNLKQLWINKIFF